MAPLLLHLVPHHHQQPVYLFSASSCRLQATPLAGSLTWNTLAPPFLLSNICSSFKTQLECPLPLGSLLIPQVEKGLLPSLAPKPPVFPALLVISMPL